jgi:hypothetical protein
MMPPIATRAITMITGSGGQRRCTERIAVASTSSVRGRPHSEQKRLSAATDEPQ